MGRVLSTIFVSISLLCCSRALAQEAPGRTAAEGPLADFGRQLDADGVRIRAQLINEMAANPIGGVKQGDTDVGQFQFGASLDLQKMLHVQGGTFHFTFVRSYGDGLAHNFTGDFIKSQEVYKNQFHPFRLSVLAYEQKLFDDKLDLLVGRLGTTAFYGRLANTCYFESGLTCGVPQVLNSEANFTFPTSATWASNVKYRFTPYVTLQAGAFEVNPMTQRTNGFDFSTAKSTGVTVPVELQLGDYDLVKHPYAWDAKLGGYESTAPFNDPYFNTKGQSLALHGGTAQLADSNRHGFYVMGEKVAWRPDPKTDESVSLFGGYIQSLEEEEVARFQLYGGAVARDVVPGRPHDIVSATFSYFDLTSREIEFLRDARLKAGGHGVNSPNEYGLEVDYSALLFNSARVAPNISYIINPDNSALPKTAALPSNILTFGIKITFNLAGWLGLPIAPNLSD